MLTPASLPARQVDAYELTRVIHTHATNVTLRLRWQLAEGTGRLLRWSEAQRQVDAASGALLQSHNESHTFGEYSATPDPASFGPTSGECG